MGDDAVSTFLNLQVVEVLDGSTTHFREPCVLLAEKENRHGQHGAEHLQAASISVLRYRAEQILNLILLKEE